MLKDDPNIGHHLACLRVGQRHSVTDVSIAHDRKFFSGLDLHLEQCEAIVEGSKLRLLDYRIHRIVSRSLKLDLAWTMVELLSNVVYELPNSHATINVKLEVLWMAILWNETLNSDLFNDSAWLSDVYMWSYGT